MKRLDLELTRFVAAYCVLLYHLQVPGFQAGYLGVDVFLVLSGYLLTLSAIKQREEGSFSVLGFMTARVRRLVPMIFMVITASLALAYFFLPPNAYSSMASIALSQNLFVTNVALASIGGYFENHVASDPLSHLWTISLEFQFYLVLALVVALIRSAKPLLVWALIVFALSLGLTLYQTNSIESSPYLLWHYRAWEFAAGMAIALLIQLRPSIAITSPMASKFALCVAVALAVTALLLGDSFTNHPGILLLLPVLATALLLVRQSAWQETLKSTTKNWILFLGAMSFPLYLWHQPLVSFAKYSSQNLADPSTVALLIGASLGLAALSQLAFQLRYRPSAHSTSPKGSKPLIDGGVLFVSTLALSVFIMKSGGLPDRYPNHQLAVLQYFDNPAPNYPYFQRHQVLQTLGSFCDFKDTVAALSQRPHNRPQSGLDSSCYAKENSGKPTVMLWGSSHAQHLRHGVMDALGATHNVLQIASSDCAPRIETEANSMDYCKHSNWFALETISKTTPDVLILAGLVNYSESRMNELAVKAKSLGAKSVVIVGPAITWNVALPQLMINDLDFRLSFPAERSFAFRPDNMRKDRAALKASAGEQSYQYVSMFDAFCNESGCLTYTDKDFLENPLTWDDSHLTAGASSMFFERQLKRFFP